MPRTNRLISLLRKYCCINQYFFSRLIFQFIVFLAIPCFSFSQSLNFTPDRGFYDSPFTATLVTDLPNASIKYTTNSDWPSDTQGTIYTGPIQINTTTILKAIAYNSTDTTKLKTHSYIFLNDVVNQPAGLSIYPPETEMDPDVVNDPQYSSTIIDGLTDIMSISISLPEEDFIDPTTGIYANPLERGREWEREASMEFLFTDGEHLQENMGIRIHGGASRGRDKKAFRIIFRDEYGPKNLEYPLFGQESDQSIDALVLRCRGGNSWVHNREEHRDRAQLYRDQIARELQGKMGHVHSKGVQAHLYINGFYWGQYNPIEYFNQSFMSSYLNGEDEDYEIWNHSGQEDGLIDTWTGLHNYIAPGITSAAMYDSIASIVDLENLADYFLLNFYGGNNDWDHNNWYASKSYQPTGKWRFFAWDNEQFFKEIELDVTDKNNDLKPSRLFNQLMGYSDFKQLFMDRVNCHFENDGVLTPNSVDNLWMEGFQRLGNSMIAESARWGDNKREDIPYTLNNEYLTEQTRLRNDYFPIRNDTVYNQMIRRGVYENTALPVVYSSQGGQVANGFQLTLTNPNTGGALYYTIDGSDPRSPAGTVSPAAIPYTTAIVMNDITEVRARVFWNGMWSPNCPVQFFTPQDYSGIAINEIHYNPNDKIVIDPTTNLPDTISGRNFEFIELKNGGNTAVNLGESYFIKGISFTFDVPTIIQPNEFIVLADDEYWFEQEYGCAPDGTYNGKLDNGGENLWLVDPFGNIIDSLRYDDDSPWPGTADNGYYSLALTDASLDNAVADNWSIQSVFHTPKAENFFTNFGEHPFSGIVINEIHYNPQDSIVPGTADTISGRNFEFVELKNISTLPIDLSSSFFARGIDYVFENGVIIQPGDFIVLAEDKSSFEDRYGFQAFDKYDGRLDNGGETLWLVNEAGVLLDAVTYDDIFPWDFNADGGAFDYSLALVNGDVDNDTYLNWSVQCNSLYTPNAENDLDCSIGQNYDGLTINEIEYAPTNGIREFIEIVNNGFVPIDLKGLRISSAVSYDFHSGQLFPGQYYLIARDSAIFENIYNVAVDGDYTGALNSIGETIWLRDLFGNTIDEVSYGVSDPWTSEPLQGAKSLALLDVNLDNDLGQNWCVQQVNRTPKAANSFADNDNDGIIDCIDTCLNFDNILIGDTCNDGNLCTSGETWDSNCNCSGGLYQDSDNDGVCDAQDQCNGIDDSLIGTACQDGDHCTQGETFDANCQCSEGVSADSDNDGTCDGQDQCPGFDDKLIGQPCDDGIICFAGSIWDSNCNCAGGAYADTDSDGVCDPLDQCPGFDDDIDTNNNGIPDGCESCSDYVTETSNAIIFQDQTANIAITTNGRVFIGDVDYHANQEVILNSGFEVKAGAVFHAFIAPCE